MIFGQVPQKRKLLLYLIAAMALFNFTLLGFRINMVSRLTYSFLVWNLFLALIPLGFSIILRFAKETKIKRWATPGLLFIWLFFLPNSFYIITDLFHLRPKQGVPLWYDLLLIFSFAWNGLIAGYLSIFDVHEFIESKWNKISAWVFTLIIIFLSSFGVYLGRYLRWNSWDIIADPFGVFFDIADRILDPLNHLQTWGLTISYSIFFFLGYLTLKIFSATEADLVGKNHI